MPRASDASSRGSEALDTSRNMVTAAFMMNAAERRAELAGADKPFSDNQKIVLETVFQNCPNRF